MQSVRDILKAIRALPRPDRLQLLVQLRHEVEAKDCKAALPQPPSGSLLELRDGFYVYTGPLGGEVDHRIAREERIDELMACIDAHRD